MRQYFARILLILTLSLLLTGCRTEPAAPATVPAQTVNSLPAQQPSDAATEAPAAAPSQEPEVTEEEQTLPAEKPTVAATEAPVTEPPQVPEATEEADSRLPYLQRIPRFDQSIYEGPGYDYSFVGTVREAGTYTIVEEAVDSEGNLWGKLKSGIGWVDLTEILSEDYKNALISANYADENLLLHGAYHHYPSDDEYSTAIAFRAYGTLRDVALFAFELTDEGLCPGPDLFTLPEMTDEMPLVAELSFPGDMSTYGIRFVDDAGTTHVYTIYISGRNGALILTEE